jgi:hypothetical protein
MEFGRRGPDNPALSERLAEASGTIDEPTDVRAQALARLAAQHEEVTCLRQAADDDARTSITRLPRRNAVIDLLNRAPTTEPTTTTSRSIPPTESSRQ